MRRMFRTAAVVAAPSGFGIALDDTSLLTPGKAPLTVRSRSLAEAIAAEWRGASETIKPQALPLTRLASTAIDLVAGRRDAVIAEIANYGGTDLLCYRAAHPPALVLRQHRAWQPLLDWARQRFDAPLDVASGVMPVAQPAASLAALAAAVARADDMELVALSLATQSCGSLILALALTAGEIDADAAFEAAQLDESFEIEQWGEDAEQTRRRGALRDDIALAARFVALLRS
jgi:chaperone required for assembly of F1-ATPase